MSWRDRLPEVRGRLLRDEPLDPFTWLRVGGPADVLFLPADEADLASFLAALDPATPVTPLGVGSNTLVRDGGVEGVVIRLAGRAFSRIERVGDRQLTAGAAALDAHLAREAAAAGLAGLEFYRGVPGSIGGALVMNAGLVPIRKKGKLPFKTFEESYALEYGTATLSVHVDAFEKNEPVLLVDDLLATGGTAAASAHLIERAGGRVVGIDFLIELAFLKGREKLGTYPLFAPIVF